LRHRRASSKHRRRDYSAEPVARGLTGASRFLRRADLSGFLGDEVELSITYVTDPSSGGVGAFGRVVVDGVTSADGFEGTTSSWTPGGPPAGSPPNSGNWQIGEQLVNFFAGTSTDDSLLLGFGLEQLATPAERADLVGRALQGLLD
jgi:hypothetical protein